jgi:MFS family permease
VFALGATSLLNDAASEMIFPLLPVFVATTIGAGPAMLGLIEGFADAVASLLRLVSGHLSDRSRRRRPFVVGGYAVAASVRPLIAFVSSPFALLGIRVLDRIGKGLRSSPRDALIADAVEPPMRGRAFGVHEAMDHAGAVIGPLIAYGLLALGLSLPSIFLWSAIPAFASVVVVATFVREPVRVCDAPASRDAPLGPRPRVLSRPFVGYLAAVTLFTLGNSSDAFLLLRAHQAGLPVAAAPLLWALHNAVKSFMGAWGGGLADRIGRRRALALGWLVYAAIYGGFAVAESASAIVVLFVAYAFHFGLVGGAQKALVADLVPAAARARGFGAYHVCVGLAALPASAIFGLLCQTQGNAVAFGAGACLAALAAGLLPFSRVLVR